MVCVARTWSLQLVSKLSIVVKFFLSSSAGLIYDLYDVFCIVREKDHLPIVVMFSILFMHLLPYLTYNYLINNKVTWQMYFLKATDHVMMCCN